MSKRAAEKKEKGKKAEKGAGGRSQKALTKNRDWIEKEVGRREEGKDRWRDRSTGGEGEQVRGEVMADDILFPLI